jgi:hypothetical protein
LLGHDRSFNRANPLPEKHYTDYSRVRGLAKPGAVRFFSVVRKNRRETPLQKLMAGTMDQSVVDALTGAINQEISFCGVGI